MFASQTEYSSIKQKEVKSTENPFVLQLTSLITKDDQDSDEDDYRFINHFSPDVWG